LLYLQRRAVDNVVVGVPATDKPGTQQIQSKTLITGQRITLWRLPQLSEVSLWHSIVSSLKTKHFSNYI